MVARKALALLPPDSPELSGVYSGLGNILRDSYDHSRTVEQTPNVQDLQDAIQAYRDAIRTNKEEMASNSIISLSNLSTVLLERYDVFGRPDDLEEARKGCEKACREGLKLKPNVVRGTHVHGEIMMVIWATGLKLLRPMAMPYGRTRAFIKFNCSRPRKRAP